MSLIEKPILRKQLLEDLYANGRVTANVKRTINGKEETVSIVSARNRALGSIEIYVKERPTRINGYEMKIQLKNPYLLSVPRVSSGDGEDGVAYFERSIYADAIMIVKDEEGAK